jgi:hypothetical protein
MDVHSCCRHRYSSYSGLSYRQSECKVVDSEGYAAYEELDEGHAALWRAVLRTFEFRGAHLFCTEL